jgi:hypothetical protein
MMSCFTSGKTASVAIGEQKTPDGTPGILAQIALCASIGFAAFDNLVAVTVLSTYLG